MPCHYGVHPVCVLVAIVLQAEAAELQAKALQARQLSMAKVGPDAKKELLHAACTNLNMGPGELKSSVGYAGVVSYNARSLTPKQEGERGGERERTRKDFCLGVGRRMACFSSVPEQLHQRQSTLANICIMVEAGPQCTSGSCCVTIV